MLLADYKEALTAKLVACAPAVANSSRRLIAMTIVAVTAGMAFGCASYGKKIASAEAAIESERQRLVQNEREISRLKTLIKNEQQKLGYLNSEAGRRDFYNGQCNRVPVEKPVLTPRPEQSCKTENETHVHAVNQCVNPGNCEYVGALYALGRLPLEYGYVLNSGCPFKAEDKTFMEEYVGMASVPLCNLTLNSKDDRGKKEKRKKQKGKLNKVINSNWVGKVLDVALSVACNVKQDPYREEYGEVTQCLADESHSCNTRYTQWENTRSRTLFDYETQKNQSDRNFAICEREITKLGYQGGDIRLKIDQAITHHNAAIALFRSASMDAHERIAAQAQVVGKLRARETDSKSPRRPVAVFH